MQYFNLQVNPIVVIEYYETFLTVTQMTFFSFTTWLLKICGDNIADTQVERYL